MPLFWLIVVFFETNKASSALIWSNHCTGFLVELLKGRNLELSRRSNLILLCQKSNRKSNQKKNQWNRNTIHLLHCWIYVTIQIPTLISLLSYYSVNNDVIMMSPSSKTVQNSRNFCAKFYIFSDVQNQSDVDNDLYGLSTLRGQTKTTWHHIWFGCTRANWRPQWFLYR